MITLKNCHTFKSFIEQSGESLSRFKITTDSRNIKNKVVFAAITGDKFNAVDFIKTIKAEYLEAVIYTDDEYNNKVIKELAANYKNTNFIKSKDTISFLQELASERSLEWIEKGNKLISICGSNGKTTTKEMLFHLLDSIEPGKVVKTKANNNNHLGVPLTIFDIEDTHKYAIVELGSNHPGEIETLCNIANPNVGITTNIGSTHMEFFDTLENVFEEESFIFHSIMKSNHSGKIFFKNNDDKFLLTLPEESFVLSYSTKRGSNFEFVLNNKSVLVNGKYTIKNDYITGSHNFLNLAVSFIIAKQLTGKVSELVEACTGFQPTFNRSQWLTQGSQKIFLDAYNANPSSMIAAIQGFIEEVNPLDLKNSIVIIGDMNELGQYTEKGHREVAEFIDNSEIKNVVLVGRFVDYYKAGLKTINAHCFESVSELNNSPYKEELNKAKTLFIKGSRSLQLEGLIDIT